MVIKFGLQDFALHKKYIEFPKKHDVTILNTFMSLKYFIYLQFIAVPDLIATMDFAITILLVLCVLYWEATPSK